MKKLIYALPFVLATSFAQADELQAKVEQMMVSSFKANGIASLDRQKQDAIQKACSSLTPPDAETMKRLEAAEFETIKWPADGNYTGGDWKEGQKIAASGRGLTWTDKTPDNNGGGCYNCHAMDPKEPSGSVSRATASCAATRKRSSSTPGANCGTPRPTTRAATCRVTAMAASSPKSRSAM